MTPNDPRTRHGEGMTWGGGCTEVYPFHLLCGVFNYWCWACTPPQGVFFFFILTTFIALLPYSLAFKLQNASGRFILFFFHSRFPAPLRFAWGRFILFYFILFTVLAPLPCTWHGVDFILHFINCCPTPSRFVQNGEDDFIIFLLLIMLSSCFNYQF